MRRSLLLAKRRESRLSALQDHYRVDESKGLVQAARAAGLFAFSGFEAVTKDGVHFLCLFDPDLTGAFCTKWKEREST